MNNICDSNHLQDCGLPSSFKPFHYNKTKVNFPTTLRELNSNFSHPSIHDNPTKNINTKVAAFETKNGESVAVFYNPYCFNHDNVVSTSYGWAVESSPINTFVLPYMCADFIYDLNGKKGPNRMGDDIWYMTLMYSDKVELSHLDPDVLGEYFTSTQSGYTYTKAQSLCSSSGGRLPTLEEGIAEYVNRYISGTAFGYLKNTGADSNLGYWITTYGVLIKYGGTLNLRCIKQSKK